MRSVHASDLLAVATTRGAGGATQCGEAQLPWEAFETETVPFPYDGSGGYVDGDSRTAMYDEQEQSWKVTQVRHRRRHAVGAALFEMRQFLSSEFRSASGFA